MAGGVVADTSKPLLFVCLVHTQNLKCFVGVFKELFVAGYRSAPVLGRTSAERGQNVRGTWLEQTEYVLAGCVHVVGQPLANVLAVILVT